MPLLSSHGRSEGVVSSLKTSRRRDPSIVCVPRPTEHFLHGPRDGLLQKGAAALIQAFFLTLRQLGSIPLCCAFLFCPQQRHLLCLLSFFFFFFTSLFFGTRNEAAELRRGGALQEEGISPPFSLFPAVPRVTVRTDLLVLLLLARVMLRGNLWATAQKSCSCGWPAEIDSPGCCRVVRAR